MQIFTLITNGFVQILIQLQGLTGNLGLSILLFTFLVRSLLLPLSLPMMQSQKKLKKIAPELKKLKEKHGSDQKALQIAQMELYKTHKINPLSGCIPQLVQIVMLFLLYGALRQFLGNPDMNGIHIDTHFLWLDLKNPDTTFILPVLAGFSQLILSLMILPGAETPDVIPNNSKDKKIQKENKKEEDASEMAAAMSKQMVFMMPLMTAFFAMKFPSGLALYWVAATIFSTVQQYFVSGWGGVTTYGKRALDFIEKKRKGNEF